MDKKVDVHAEKLEDEQSMERWVGLALTGMAASMFLFFGLGIFFDMSLHTTKGPGAAVIATASSVIGVFFAGLGILTILRIRRD